MEIFCFHKIKMPLSISCESSVNLHKSNLFVGQKSNEMMTSSITANRPTAGLSNRFHPNKTSSGRDFPKNNLPGKKQKFTIRQPSKLLSISV